MANEKITQILDEIKSLTILELADLVKVSKIDTKKFGNNISSHINFKNTYE